MKKRLVNHIVAATTQRRPLVLAATALLCAASVLSTVFLLESDLTFKGMIGQGAPPVQAYDRVIRDFEVSGVISVALEPLAEQQSKILDLRRRMDRLVLGALDQKARARVLAVLKESAEEMTTLSERDQLLALVDLFRLLPPTARKAALADSRLGAADRDLLLAQVDSQDQQRLRAVYRKFQKLRPGDRARLAARVKTLDRAGREAMVRSVLGKMSVYDKKDQVEGLLALAPPRRQALLAKLEALDQQVSTILAAFRSRTQKFADALKARMASGVALPGMTEPPSAVARGVLYSEELSFSRDQLMFLILVSPQKDIDQMKNARQFCATVDGVLAGMKLRHPQLRVRRTGFAAAQMDARKAMFKDFGVMMTVTVLGILLVSLLGLKSLEFPLLTMIPLGVGIVIMFGVYALFGQLNLVSMMSPIILFGLGIDYAIHFGARYGEVRLELGPRAPQAEVLRGTFNSVGPGMLVASITTVFAFLALLASTIGGLAQAGLMAASGVVSSFLAMVYIMPMLVCWRERLSGERVRFLRVGRYLRLGRLADSGAGAALGLLIVALALAAVVLVPRIRLERDGMKLSPDGLESIILSKDLEAKFQFTDAQAYFILQGYETLKKFRRELARQEGGRPAYPALNTMRVLDARKAIRTFEKLGWKRDIRTLPRYAREYAERTNLMGGSNRNIAQVYEFIARNYVHWDSDSYLVIVPPSGYVWDRDLTEMFARDLARLESKFGVTPASFVLIWMFLVDHLLSDLITSSLVAFALVLLVLLAITRSLRGTLICSSALAISLTATLSIIGLLGLRLNCVNIIAFPIIIGLGIDYIVHIYYRMVHEERAAAVSRRSRGPARLDVVAAVASTGKAVMLTTLTTLVAFGAISFSAHKGMSMMGIFSFIGLSVAFLTSIFLVPLLVKLVHGGRRKNEQRESIQ